MSDSIEAATADDELPPLEWTITLRRPIEHAGGTITELRLRPPTAGEKRIAELAIKNGGIADLRKHDTILVSKVTGIPEPALDKIDIDQMDEAIAYVRGFTLRTPRMAWR